MHERTVAEKPVKTYNGWVMLADLMGAGLLICMVLIAIEAPALRNMSILVMLVIPAALLVANLTAPRNNRNVTEPESSSPPVVRKITTTRHPRSHRE